MELKLGQIYHVTVIRVLDFGAVVALEDGSTELIHISNISDKYVSNVSDFVEVGHTYSAIGCAGKKKDVELTLKMLDLQPKSRNACPTKLSTRSAMKRSGQDSKKSDLSNNVVSNLDEMIANSDKVFEDKFKCKLNTRLKSRRNRSKRR